jgi:hypothetical protein
LTLFTTPVVYLYLDRLNERVSGHRKPAGEQSGEPPRASHEPATV